MQEFDRSRDEPLFTEVDTWSTGTNGTSRSTGTNRRRTLLNSKDDVDFFLRYDEDMTKISSQLASEAAAASQRSNQIKSFCLLPRRFEKVISIWLRISIPILCPSAIDKTLKVRVPRIRMPTVAITLEKP